MNIYVGNLPNEATEDDLRQAFEAFGQVTVSKIITDKFTGQSRGFGFVEMPNSPEAQAALNGLNGTDLKGSALKVNEARPRSDRGSGGFGRGGSGGGETLLIIDSPTFKIIFKNHVKLSLWVVRLTLCASKSENTSFIQI